MARARILLIATLLTCMILMVSARIDAAQGEMEATSSETAHQNNYENIQENMEDAVESRFLPIPQSFEDMDVLLRNHPNEVRGFTVLGH